MIKLFFLQILPAVLCNLVDEACANVQHSGAVSSLATDDLKSQPKINLITSVLVDPDSDNEHMQEIIKAVTENVKLLGTTLARICVLLEVHNKDRDEAIVELKHKIGVSDLSESVQEKFEIVNISQAPTYNDFFETGINNYPDEPCMITNADVVFDETLTSIDTATLAHMKGFVLAVKPPPLHGAYKAAYHSECNSIPRCTVGRADGWLLGGASWDSYIFAPTTDFKKNYYRQRTVEGKQTTTKQELSFPMFSLGAENKAAFELFSMGVNLSNPCHFVNAFHWHCQGTKMHVDAQDDGGAEYYTINFHNLAPCGQMSCTGLLEGRIQRGLCKSGHILQSEFLNHKEVDIARQLFRNHENIDLCCSDKDCDALWVKLRTSVPRDHCGRLVDEWNRTSAGHTEPASLCMSASDTNCLISRDWAIPDEGRTSQTVGARRFFNQRPWLTTAQDVC